MNAITKTADAEEWRQVDGFSGFYEVSSRGRVRSVARVIHGPKKRQTVHGRILAISTNGKGYQKVNLWADNADRIRYVHRLVLTAFVSQPPEGMEACHNDGDQSNNCVSNLRWDTKRNNHSDKVKHGTLLRGELLKHAKLTATEVIDIRYRVERGELQSHIASIFGITQSSVSDVCGRRTWRHV